MNGNDRAPPSDERTVFRPNPGRRLAPAPGVAADSQASGWYAGLGAQRTAAAALPAAADLNIDELVSPNANPVLRAAGPLLLLLGGLRAAVLRASLDSLMEQVRRAIGFFEQDVRAAGLTPEQARSATFVMCAAADDIVLNIPTDDRQKWARYSMQQRFFQDLRGGELFFGELSRTLSDPVNAYWLLELMHACLALGFQGKYRVPPNNPAELPRIQRQAYEALRRVKPKVVRDLSPHWQGQDLGKRRWSRVVPTWAVAAAAAVLLLGVFFTLRARLETRSEEAGAQLLALHTSDPVALKRRDPAPPPPPPPARQAQMERLRRDLPAGLCLTDRGSAVAIRTCGLSLFASGSDAVLPKYVPLVRSIATLIDGEAKLNPQPSPLWVVGHTDSTRPGKGDRFGSNAELSRARANAVAALLKPVIAHPELLRADGKADTDPVDRRNTPEAYALNRRVEILIPRND